jgi:hypothetical protein
MIGIKIFKAYHSKLLDAFWRSVLAGLVFYGFMSIFLVNTPIKGPSIQIDLDTDGGLARGKRSDHGFFISNCALQ